MSKKQEELEKKNKEILVLLQYFHENYNGEGASIIRDLKSISARLNEMITEDARNESSKQ